MAVTLNPGQSVTLTATALLADGVTTNTNAGAISWTETGAGTIVGVADHGSTAGVGTVTLTFVADGDVTVTASVTNADGTVVATGTDNPTTVTCATPPAVENTASVSVTEGTVA